MEQLNSFLGGVSPNLSSDEDEPSVSENISTPLSPNLRVNVSKYQRKIKKSRSRAKNRFRSFFVYSKFKVLKKVKWQ